MRVTRRRFIAIAAATTLAGPAAPAAGRRIWRGHALGADATIAIEGEAAEAALGASLDTLRRMERLFSLYDPDSALSRLNRAGELDMPPEFARLVSTVTQAHALTGGLFDPTIQPLFAAMAKAGGALREDERELLQALVGWDKVSLSGSRLSLRPGMALTFNGIAQGFAADRVVETLAAHGLPHVAANIGEWRAGEMPVKLAVENAEGGLLETRLLRAGAVATSSPAGFRFADGSGHILSPLPAARKPQWPTASVEASAAAIADALSTALVLSEGDGMARRLVAAGAARRILLQDAGGEVTAIA